MLSQIWNVPIIWNIDINDKLGQKLKASFINIVGLAATIIF